MGPGGLQAGGQEDLRALLVVADAQAYSGNNNFWLWGPPPADRRAAIAVNVDPALLHREFAHVRLIATFWNGLGVSDDEQGAQVFLATGLKSSWPHAWPALRDYS